LLHVARIRATRALRDGCRLAADRRTVAIHDWVLAADSPPSGKSFAAMNLPHIVASTTHFRQW
jgi:hypothetical protein